MKTFTENLQMNGTKNMKHKCEIQCGSIKITLEMNLTKENFVQQFCLLTHLLYKTTSQINWQKEMKEENIRKFYPQLFVKEDKKNKELKKQVYTIYIHKEEM
jgi:hypothetical protein